MKKLAFLLALILAINLPLNVAATTRASSITPQLSYSGSSAKCIVAVVGDNSSQHIEVTMKLMYGSSTVASWTGSGYGYVYLSKTATITTGRTYKLVVEVTVDGVTKDPVYVTKTS